MVSRCKRNLITAYLMFPLFSSAPAWAEGVNVDAASASQKEAAQEAFSKGDAEFDVQDYEAALEHFRTSYEHVHSPNSRLMVARSLLELRRLDEAYDEFIGVIADAGNAEDYAETRATAKRERDALLSRLAWLTVDLSLLPAGSTLKVAERPRHESAPNEQIAVNPGKTLVEAAAPDGTLAQAEVHLAAGRRANVKLIPGEIVHVGLAPKPEQVEKEQPKEDPVVVPPPRSEPAKQDYRPWAIASGAIGIAGGATFAVLGSMSRARYRSLEDACSAGLCPPEAEADIDAGRNFQLIANVGLGVGVAGVATSLVLFILDANQRSSSSTEVVFGPQSVTLRGQF